MRKYGNTLKMIRLNNNMTQEELGRELGFDRSVISRLENNSVQPSLQQLELYSNYFNVPMEELIKKDNVNKYNINRRYFQYLTAILTSVIGMILSPYGIIICLVCVLFAIKRKLPIIVVVFLIFSCLFCLEDILFLFGIDLLPGIMIIR